MIRAYRNMCREVAQILQIEDRGLHRYGKTFRRNAQRA